MSLASSSFSFSLSPFRLYILRWWLFFRPRAHILVPSFLLVVILIQMIAAALDYNNIINITVGNPDPSPSENNPVVIPISSSSSFDPQQQVAFAIPVGGRTERSASLRGILTSLLNGGALATHIYVFEDVLGRPNAKGFPSIAAVCSSLGVNLVSTSVSRDRGEDSNDFGIHLARHYHTFLDYLLADPVIAAEEVITASKIDSYAASSISPPSPLLMESRIHSRAYAFAVVIEDDLELSSDVVKYFFSMSLVMRSDPTLYCAAAHQDNAFLGIHRDDGFDMNEKNKNERVSLDLLGFDFRRGNHFMAPGWMTSSSIYNKVVRPYWLTSDQGTYAFSNYLHLRNGHWDRFFDSLIGKKDCIFPELPRITHQGADGFTVDKRGQMELYSNLRLAKLSPDTDYGDLSRLTYQGYISKTEEFIRSAYRLTALEESHTYRKSHLIYIVSAQSDNDEEWNSVFNQFFGLIGVGGYGGHVGYVKVRGIFRGAVFVRWASNLLLLVGQYSPYHDLVLSTTSSSASQHKNGQLGPLSSMTELTYAGCYVDEWKRDLPHQVKHYTRASLTPLRCSLSCSLLGYRYSGLQNGFECWCGDGYGKAGTAAPTECSIDCNAVREKAAKQEATQLLAKNDNNNNNNNNENNNDNSSSPPTSQPLQCGAGFRNSIYWNTFPATSERWKESLKSPADVKYLAGSVGDNCDKVCAEKGGKDYSRCDERFFPLIHRSCTILKSIFTESKEILTSLPSHLTSTAICSVCQEEDDPERGFATPSIQLANGNCFLSRARYHRCNWEPPKGIARACTCVK